MFCRAGNKKDNPYIFGHKLTIDYESITIISSPKKQLSGLKTQNRTTTFQNPKLCAIFAA
jgi:hypothetical protein